MESITGKITLQQIFSEQWEGFCKQHPECLTNTIQQNVEKMLSCRNPDKMGFALYQCNKCPDVYVTVPHSCKSRFCNICGKVQTDKWISSCHKLLPNTDYYHLTFTIPKQLRIILAKIPDLLHVLFRASADTLFSFFKDERHITPAITEVLHTFGRDMKWNPHIHIILSAGGLDEEGNWKEISFIPFKMLRERWKVILLNAMKSTLKEKAIQQPQHSQYKFFTLPQFLRDFFYDLYKISWYVYLRTTLINVKGTIQYVGRYTKKPIIAETRILAYDGTTVTFVYHDHKDNMETKVTLPVFEFIKRLIRHIPARYFRLIRHYGLVANRVSSRFKNILTTLFGTVATIMKFLTWRERQKQYRNKDPLLCPHCGDELYLFARFFPSKLSGSWYIVRP